MVGVNLNVSKYLMERPKTLRFFSQAPRDRIRENMQNMRLLDKIYCNINVINVLQEKSGTRP